ncbi:MAG: adenylyl-sulfate kinase [Myxococcota bacterium]
MSEYPAAVLAHFRNPVGAGRLAPDAARVAAAEARDPAGGQRVRMHVRLGPGERLEDVRFQAFGCPVTIAVASAAVERVVGRGRAAALALTAPSLADALELSPEQARLAELPIRALRLALAYLAAPETPMAPDAIPASAMSPKSENLTSSESHVSRAQREALLRHSAVTLWFTGLSGSGKSTLARALEQELIERRVLAYVLDGDNVRHGLCADLGFSAEDRVENIRRVGEVARLMNESGVLVLTAFISPYRADRARARALLPAGEFLEVFVDCPLDVCERRDPKGLYRKARAGALPDFTGVSAPYEAPDAPELRIATGTRPLAECVRELVAALEERGLIPRGS